MFNNVERTAGDDGYDKDLKHYMLPSVQQTGYLIDVRVGHIERFKTYEELQFEYHLRVSGFLERL